jgi:hypothetical protein
VKLPHRVVKFVAILDTTMVVSNALAPKMVSLHVQATLVEMLIKQNRGLDAHQLDSHTRPLQVAWVNRFLRRTAAQPAPERPEDQDTVLGRDVKPVSVSTASGNVKALLVSARRLLM